MAYGKLQIQSCGFLWFLSTVYLVRCVTPKGATSPRFNLVVQRPRIAGGSLTAPLDSSVKLLPWFGTARFHNTLRLQYGAAGKCLVMRASSAVELQKWASSILAAVAASKDSTDHIPASATAQYFRVDARPTSTKKSKSRRTKEFDVTRVKTRTNPSSSQEGRDPTNCSTRQMMRRNVPSAMQFAITLGQIIAAAS